MSTDYNIIGATAYLKTILDADRIKQDGVADLIVLIANDKVKISDAAEICNESPLVQLAICDVVREYPLSGSMKDIASSIQELLQKSEGFFGVLQINLNTAKLHHLDLKKAAKIKECGVPDLIAIIDQGWATLDEAVETCCECLETQREACRLVWSHNCTDRGRLKPILLSEAVTKFKG